jgi:TolB-like protein
MHRGPRPDLDPGLERTGVTHDPKTEMLAEDVADEIIANIANGPAYVVGARNQAIAARVWPTAGRWSR